MESEERDKGIMNILLIRHADTTFTDRIPGRLPDIHLSEHGKQQAVGLASRLEKVKIDIVYSSPLDRALETADPVVKNKNIRMVKDDHFIEIDFGKWTGKRFDELENEFGWKQFHFYRNGSLIPGGESPTQVQSRMIGGIERLLRRHENENIAIVSHNDPIKSILAYCLGISLDLFLRMTISTASVSIVSFIDKNVFVGGINLTGELFIENG